MPFTFTFDESSEQAGKQGIQETTELGLQLQLLNPILSSYSQPDVGRDDGWAGWLV